MFEVSEEMLKQIQTNAENQLTNQGQKHSM
jgi:hypothetical protein